MAIDSDPLALPPFANSEVRAAFAQLQSKEKQGDSLEIKRAELEERIRQLQTHFSAVTDELEQNQRVIEVKRAETQRRRHEQKLQEMELGSLREDVVSLEAGIAESEHRLVQTQSDVERLHSQINTYKLKLSLNEDELSSWLQAAKVKLEDEKVARKYLATDELKLAELRRALESALVQKTERLAELDAIKTENASLELELDRLGNELKLGETSRDHSISEWQTVIAKNASRDDDLGALAEQYIATQSRLKQNELTLREKRNFAELIDKENAKKATLLATIERQLVKFREDANKAKDDLEVFAAESEAVKLEIAANANQTQGLRMQTSATREAVETKRVRMDSTQNSVENARKKLQKAEGKRLTNDELVKEAAETLNELHKNFQEQHGAKHGLTTALTHASSLLQGERGDEQNTLFKLSAEQTALKSVETANAKLKGERERQTELIYAVDLEAQLLERRVGRLQGAVGVAEASALSAEAGEKEKRLQEHVRIGSLLEEQIKRQENEIKLARRDADKEHKTLEQVSTGVRELAIEAEVLARSETSLNREREEKQLLKDALKLETNRGKETLVRAIERAFGGEAAFEEARTQKTQKTKQQETKLELLRTEQRQLDAEKHALVLKQGELETRERLLVNRHDHLLKLRKTSDDGEVKTQAYYILKAAQEKEDLQRRLDEVIAAIKQGEREILALQNSLAFMQSQNRCFTDYLRKAAGKEVSQGSLTGTKTHENQTNECRLVELEIAKANEQLHKTTRAISDLQRTEQDIRVVEEASARLHEAEKTHKELEAIADTMAQEVKANVRAAELAKYSAQGRAHPQALLRAKEELLKAEIEAIHELSRSNPELEHWIQDQLRLRGLAHALQHS